MIRSWSPSSSRSLSMESPGSSAITARAGAAFRDSSEARTSEHPSNWICIDIVSTHSSVCWMRRKTKHAALWLLFLLQTTLGLRQHLSHWLLTKLSILWNRFVQLCARPYIKAEVCPLWHLWLKEECNNNFTYVAHVWFKYVTFGKLDLWHQYF